MRRHIALMGHALGALHRRWRRSMVLMTALTLVVAMAASVLLMLDALHHEASRWRASAPDVMVQQLVAGRPGLIDSSLAQAIRPLPGVARVEPRTWGYLFIPALQSNVVVMGLPVPFPQPDLPSMRTPQLLSGQWPPSTTDEQEAVCVLGHAVAREFGVQQGDRIRVPSVGGAVQTLKVSGIFQDDVGWLTADLVLCPTQTVRQLLGLPEQTDRVVDLAVVLNTPDEAAVIARNIVDMGPGLRVIERAQLERVQSILFGRRAGLALVMLLPALVVVLLVSWDRLSGLDGLERRELAILRACGWSSSDVLLARLYESWILGGVAALVGGVLAFVWIFHLQAFGWREVLGGWSTVMPLVPLRPGPWASTVLGAATLVIGPFVAVSVAPAWRASSADPVSLLRGS